MRRVEGSVIKLEEEEEEYSSHSQKLFMRFENVVLEIVQFMR